MSYFELNTETGIIMPHIVTYRDWSTLLIIIISNVVNHHQNLKCAANYIKNNGALRKPAFKIVFKKLQSLIVF